jgi:hypothetical protein
MHASPVWKDRVLGAGVRRRPTPLAASFVEGTCESCTSPNGHTTSGAYGMLRRTQLRAALLLFFFDDFAGVRELQSNQSFAFLAFDLVEQPELSEEPDTAL